jgi:hypothetical protein
MKGISPQGRRTLRNTGIPLGLLVKDQVVRTRLEFYILKCGETTLLTLV